MNHTDEQIEKINIFADMVTFKTQHRGKDLSDVLSELDVAILKDVLDIIKRLKAENERLNVELVGMRGAANSYKMHYDNAEVEIKRLNSLCTSKDVIINDLNAEVERYKSEHKDFVKKLSDVASLNTLLFDRKNELESEARKGFAERLKDECSGNPYLDDYVLNKCIDNLLEEMEKENVV